MDGQTSRAPHVAIVGCGVSGLRCADILLQSGAKVTIFEARDRIGGRVHQIETGGYLVDVGANWIHEPNNNPILQLAKQSNTVTLERPTQYAAFDRHGSRFTNEKAVRLRTTLKGLVGEAEDQSMKHWAEIDPQGSVLDWIREQATSRYRHEPVFPDALIDEAERLGQFFGDPASTISLKFACMEEGTGGTDLFMASTYKGVLTLLAGKISGKCDLRLDTEVVHIQRNSDSGSKVRVKMSRGDVEEFDEVVVSCPLGWLKQNKERAFSPALPTRPSEAIDSLSYGTLEKLYITFPTAFWITDPSSSMSKYPCATHFHSPLYGKHFSDTPANAVVFSLAHLPDGCAHPTLLFYIHGPCGAKVVESVDGMEPHSRTYNQSIDDFARPYYSLLPNFSKEDPSTQPVSWFCSAWQQDRFAGNGSYSNIQVGIKDAYGDVEAMQSGCGLGEERGIWFIGEHTAPAALMGTTTGAYVSGERDARKICGKWGL